MKTQRGVYKDIKQSDYSYTVVTENSEITFYFSSLFYLGKFQSEYEDECRRLTYSLNNIYKNKYDINGDILALFRLYSKIEKRGFYVEINGVPYYEIENLLFKIEVKQW